MNNIWFSRLKRSAPGRISPFLILALFAGVMPILSGCSATRKAEKTAVNDRSPEFLLRKMAANQLQADWFSAKARISYEDNYTKVKATAAIEMRKDSLIWIAVRKFGFEVARMQITPDSVYLIDRLNNQYLVEGVDYFRREFQFPANFQLLQTILLGNPLFFTTHGLQVESKQPDYHLFGKDDTMETHYWINGTDYSLKDMALQDVKEKRLLQLSLLEYDKLKGNQNFSYFRNFKISSQETGDLSIGIQFSEVEFNIPKDIRFEIPERYTKMED